MIQRISGYTQIIAHVGVPTESFKAPLIYNPYFVSQGVDRLVVPMGCEAEDFPEFLRLLFRLRNFAGALITMPHKVTVVDLLDSVSKAVEICGACNAVKRTAEGELVGDMFDGEGFVRGVLRKGRAVSGASALVVGCGGVGSAISASLAQAGLQRLRLYDVRGDVMEGLAAGMRRHYPQLELELESADPTGCDLVINATPLGSNPGEPLPLEVGALSPEMLVGEVVLKQEITPLLAAARERGCLIQVGTDMLFEQIPAYLEFFSLPTTTPEVLRRLAQLP